MVTMVVGIAVLTWFSDDHGTSGAAPVLVGCMYCTVEYYVGMSGDRYQLLAGCTLLVQSNAVQQGYRRW
jgi:hypothetical protein